MKGPGNVIFATAVGVAAQELHVAHLDRVAAAHLADDARQHGVDSPARVFTIAGVSISTPSSAVAKRFE